MVVWNFHWTSVTHELKDIIGELDSGDLDFGLAIQKINDLSEKVAGEELQKLDKLIFFTAKEISHYFREYRSAETDQWKQSFGFELERSQTEFVKYMKKYLKAAS